MPLLPRSWKDEFALAAAIKREDIRHREKLAQADAQERTRAAEATIQQKRREQEAAAIQAVLASPQRLVAFEARLDRYDAKTVEFLTENVEALARVRERIREMLDQAHQLPDGRRVFKTEDGLRVFDEHGQPVAPEILTPDMVDDRKTRWEVFKSERAAERRTAEDQAAALSYQDRLDEARIRHKRGDVSEKELDAIEADLAAKAPDALRERLGLGQRQVDGPPSLSATAAPPDTMDVLMRQTGHLPASPPAPG